MATAYIVDDVPDICETLGLALETHGYRCVAHRDFESALNDMRAGRHPCIAFIDLHVPGKVKAHDFVKQARQMHPDLKIIAISGAANVGIMAGEIGADGYLLKPFILEELIKRTEQFCPKVEQS